MNIDRFKREHADILDQIDALRRLTHAGVAENASAIAQGIVAMSSTIRLHLAVEDRLLYPALQASGNDALAQLGKRFQDEMGEIASNYMAFARRWNTAERVTADPAGFKGDANVVLRSVYDRMRHEDRDFYPRIEAAESTLAW
ncbi:hemerythrin domain-containing protein [Melaminivora alkalimesophila]|uniref:Hemerythrin HHE cation binding domain-containing protein n=1 Tax=Melaminivora alkalimesophila TaxID=1165852 RepID=A0A317REL9_9BURK|nr:hemerythrin domain-containing protein [Melaminivora alkalimesophila]PWW46906.1 hemerythrin HHE cation binding domain-containing protein [Melaminivora alkalimesophila]